MHEPVTKHGKRISKIAMSESETTAKNTIALRNSIKDMFTSSGDAFC
jgi:hypothetical protein